MSMLLWKHGRMKPFSSAAAIMALLLVCAPPPAAAQSNRAHDYLTLVLSWSPTYCASEERRGDAGQCAPGRAYAFVVHGLWPQYERGWPDYCETRERWVPDSTIRGMLDIMPSKQLVIHEWRKHGTCSGLGQRDYFATTRKLFERVKIPARYLSPQDAVVTTPRALVADFLKTNPDLPREALSVQCGNRRDTGRLRELRICFDRDLEPRACGDNERQSCRAGELVLPPVR